jgi:hypothetical protein
MLKIHVAIVEAFKEKRDEIQHMTKIGGKTSLGSNYFILLNFIPSFAFDALLC